MVLRTGLPWWALFLLRKQFFNAWLWVKMTQGRLEP
jgi:hypothetical protein